MFFPAAFLGLLGVFGGASGQVVVVPLPDGSRVALSTRGPSAFRVSLMVSDRDAFPTPMIEPDKEDAAFEQAVSRLGAGIKASFGQILVTTAGALQLSDANEHVLATSEPLQAASNEVIFSATKAAVYGRGASPDDAERLTPSGIVRPLVANRGTYAPYYYSKDGYSALGVVASPSEGRFLADYEQDVKEQKLSWSFNGSGWDLYLMPAASLAEGTLALYALTGSPRIPPRYAFGFIASRWGWQNPAYIEQTLSDFRSKEFPIDAIIFDFEWFTNESDYGFTPEGKPWYDDFGFNGETFPNPQEQLQHYRDTYNIHVGGIRKPRLGNTQLLDDFRAKGWILPNGEPGGSWPPAAETYADHRNLDYSQQPVRDFYASHLAPVIDAGISFFWNDEGETNFYTFHWWNVAQLEAHRARTTNQRFYSINRAFSPGMARLGATVWTGDINPVWSDLQQTPGMMLNWILAGAPYVACDTGGFSRNTTPALLTRWMQVATYMPTMRVHSTIDATPHWPWLFGDAAAAAIRDTLNVRYQLIPYHYSLAHALYKGERLWVRPLVMDYPDDVVVPDLTTEWMDGDILVAPVLNEDSSVSIYLPEGLWYSLNDVKTQVIQGPKQILRTAAFTEVPTFVKAGTILPLGPVIQHTEALPGGPLEVQVFEGANGTFRFVEDDGSSTSYEAGNVKITSFTWSDAERTLSWTTSGFLNAPGQTAFTSVFVTFFGKDGSSQKTATENLSSQGKIVVNGRRSGTIKYGMLSAIQSMMV